MKKFFFFFFLFINIVNFLLISLDESFSQGTPSIRISNRILAVSSFGAAPAGLIAINKMKISASRNQTAVCLDQTLKILLVQNILMYLLIFSRPAVSRKKEHRKVSYNNGRF